MGYRISWIARAGENTEELLQLSGRQLTGERHEFPDVGWYLLELSAPQPWVLLIADGSANYADLDSSHAQSLSQGGHETLYFWCSETVMASELACFKDGAEVWAIRYDCAQTDRLALSGVVPEDAHAMLACLRAKQDAADDDVDFIYELAANVARSLVGFRHDADIKTANPEPFQVLGKTLKLKTHVEFRSSAFPPYDREEEGINPGRYGKRLAEFLVAGLKQQGFEALEPVAEDWGWVVPIKNNRFPLSIGCGNYDEYPDDGFLCFIEPHLPTVRSWLFWTVDTTATINSLQAAIDQILAANPAIRDRKWWSFEEFNRGGTSR
jgi:hypothetical protein